VIRESLCGIITRIGARKTRYRGLIPGIGKIFSCSAKRPPRQPVLSKISFQCLPGEYFSGDNIEKNEMGEACSMYGGEERRIQGFGGET
jgi:hypothetical protein